jgi:hypothetical protein
MKGNFGTMMQVPIGPVELAQLEIFGGPVTCLFCLVLENVCFEDEIVFLTYLMK